MAGGNVSVSSDPNKPNTPETDASWSPETLELVKLTKKFNLNNDQLAQIIPAFANIDMFIKISKSITALLEKGKAGTLGAGDFLAAILSILQSDKPLVGTKIEALHSTFGVPMIAKAPRPKKAKGDETAKADNKSPAGSKS